MYCIKSPFLIEGSVQCILPLFEAYHYCCFTEALINLPARQRNAMTDQKCSAEIQYSTIMILIHLSWIWEYCLSLDWTVILRPLVHTIALPDHAFLKILFKYIMSAMLRSLILAVLSNQFAIQHTCDEIICPNRGL